MDARVRVNCQCQNCQKGPFWANDQFQHFYHHYGHINKLMLNVVELFSIGGIVVKA